MSSSERLLLLDINELIARFRDEFDERRRRNPRYSMRAFARDTSISQGTISKLFRGKTRPNAGTIEMLSERYRNNISSSRAALPLANADGSYSANGSISVDFEVITDCPSDIFSLMRGSNIQFDILSSAPIDGEPKTSILLRIWLQSPRI